MGRRDLPLEDYVEQRTLISAFVEANPGFLLPDPEGGPRRSVPYRLRGLDPKAGAGAPYAWLAGTRRITHRALRSMVLLLSRHLLDERRRNAGCTCRHQDRSQVQKQ